MIRIALLVPLLLTGVAGSGFVVNEWSHGGLSETMGMGHHHMLDYGNQHCMAGPHASMGPVQHGGSSHSHQHPANLTACNGGP